MGLIWTVTLNAVIDHIYVVHGQGDDTGVSDASFHVPAGKGVNVSRALAALGVSSAALVVTDAEHEQAYRTSLEADGIRASLVVARPGIRHHATIIRETGTFHAREAGPPCSLSCLDAVRQALSAAVGDDVALSGSLPPGMDDDAYAVLEGELRARGCYGWLDCSGAPLARAMFRPPYAVKLNQAEAAALWDRPIDGPGAAAEAVEWMIGRGVGLACVTLGPKGLVMGSDRHHSCVGRGRGKR